MSIQDKAIETLAGLGLTVLQAKVYLTLAKEGKSTVKGIAKTSNIARQDLYRITQQLLNLGLIEKLIDTPTKFKAIPIKAAIDMLIGRRKKQHLRLPNDAILNKVCAETANELLIADKGQPTEDAINEIALKLRK